MHCFSFLRASKSSSTTSPQRVTQSSRPSEAARPPPLCCCACEPLPEYTQGAWTSAPLTKEACDSMRSVDDISNTIADEIQRRSNELRKLSLDMWDHPEIAWEEHHTHDLFVTYLQKQSGWNVTPHAYKIDTAFQAEFVHQPDGATRTLPPVIGFQSELDALPGIGHACGHNLIAISGIAASLGLAKAAVEHNFAVKIVLIGTPAEEAAGGKRVLLERDAYKGMDTCLMVHPSPMDSTGTMLAVQQMTVDYTGHSAHAGAAPWEGVNAQDAGVLAYMNISALRQQIPPSHRVHGIIQGKNWAANVIPESCTLVYNTRAPSSAECSALTERVKKCFNAAGEATGCKVCVNIFSAYKDVANNESLADAFRAIAKARFDREVTTEPFAASTDFGDVTYALPALHAEYAIPLNNPRTDGNHTIGFAEAAKTQEAHKLTLESAVNIATVGAKVATDAEYRKSVWEQWRKWKKTVAE